MANVVVGLGVANVIVEEGLGTIGGPVGGTIGGTIGTTIGGYGCTGE